MNDEAKELYVIVKKFSDGHEDVYYCTFDLDNAFMWSDIIEGIERAYYDFEIRKYNAEHFETIKKLSKNT